MSIMCPCKDCPDRYEACHDHCGKYKEWKVLKAGEAESIKALGSTTRHIGERRFAKQHNRISDWKQHKD